MNVDYNTETQEITVELNTPAIEFDTPTGGRGLKGETGSAGPQGPQGIQGEKGDKGDTGEDGYTPIKGVDYFTQEDIASLNIPTKVSDLTNDLNFIDNTVNNLTNYYTSSNTYTKSEVDSLIATVSSLNIEVVQTLPTQDISTTTIYLVPNSSQGTNNYYDEYIYVSNAWELIGSTQVDLTNYYTKTETDNLLDGKTDFVDANFLKTAASGGTQITAAQKTMLSEDNHIFYISFSEQGVGTWYYTSTGVQYYDGPPGFSEIILFRGSGEKVYRFTISNDNYVSMVSYDIATTSDLKDYLLKTQNYSYRNGASTPIYRKQLLVQTENGLEPFTSTSNSTATTKTKLYPKYIPGASILYYDSTTTVESGQPLNANIWEQYNFDLRYTFNITSTQFDGRKPIYMKMSVNADGTLSPVYSQSSDKHPLVQTLPSTADGYVYVYLGQAYSFNYIDLMPVHPIYEYKNGKIREYIDTSDKQDTLVSGTNIKTINNTSILGSGDITTFSGDYDDLTDKPIYDASYLLSAIGQTITNEQYNELLNACNNKNIINVRGLPYYYYNASMGNIIALWFIDENNVLHFISVSKTSNNHTVTEDEKLLLNEDDIWNYLGPVYANIAQYYDSTSTYNIGDYVLYGEEGETAAILYKCTTAITVPEDWDSTKWTQVITMEEIKDKQDTLVSGTNIKTINNESLLGSGNITIQGGGGTPTDVRVNGTSITSNNVADIQTEGTYNSSTNKIATMSDIPTVPTIGNAKTYYGTSSTSASTAAKTVTCSGFTLETGATIFVKFTNANSYNGTATLNVNSTGARDIATVGDTKTSRYYWKSGEVVGFIYDGTNYVMIEQGNATTTYYGVTKLSSSTSSTSEVLAATPKAVKTAYDLANGKQNAITSTNKLDYSLIDNTPTIPSKTSDLTNDSGFITGYTETDPIFSASAASGISSSDITNWNNKVDMEHISGPYRTYTMDQGMYIADDTAYLYYYGETDTTHKQRIGSGSFIIVTGTTRKDFLILSGDSNYVGYSTASNGSFDEVILSSDVVNNLTTTSTGSVLDASQGKALKDLIDAIVVPTKTSDLTNDSGFITSSYHDSTKQDAITSTNKLDYSLLSNTPTIPTVPTTVSSFTNDAGYITSSALSGYATTSALDDVQDQVDANTSNIIANNSKIGTLANLTTTTKTDLVSAVNEVNTKNIMTTYLAADYSIPNTNTAYDLLNTAVSSSIGTKLTFSNGKIVIGAGVSKVKVSYTVKTMSNANTTRTFTYLMSDVNGTPTALSQEGYWYGGTNWQVVNTYGPIILDVNQGDTFYLRCYGYKGNAIAGATSTFKPTLLTVEVIE